MMRFSILFLAAFLTIGCSSNKPHENKGEVITRIGVITAKEQVDLNEIEQDSNTRTSVFGSISSGGNVSIGLGFLLSPLSSSNSDSDPVRYEVELEEGNLITIYHESRDFEVGDCVEITSHPDEEKNPPLLKRNKGGCAP